MTPSVPQRPPLVRPRRGRMIGGVATGLAEHLGWSVSAVRVVLLASTLAGGLGAILYAWLWALVRAADVVEAGAPGATVTMSATASFQRTGPQVRRREAAAPARLGDVLIGLLLLLAAAAVLGARYGWAPTPGLALPVLVVIGGAALAYSQLDEVERSRWATRTGVGTRAAALRVVGGLVLVLAGVLMVVVPRTDFASAAVVLIAIAAVLAGAAIVLAPWGLRLWHDLELEREARAREAERADIAAHLHDSVLQTLALIQRHDGDAGQVSRLARAQERELREWLYGSPSSSASSLAALVSAAAADVDDRHGVAIDVVCVGDRSVDERGGALVAALREAMVNAAVHAGPPVQVYLEVSPEVGEAFVRDRGAGFDLAAVPADRLGVRDSIIRRMERHGGEATVRSSADSGTEVRLVMPFPSEGGGQR